MSKFDSAMTEYAYAVAGHGFTDGEYGDSTEGPAWNALVYIDPVVLDNVGEHEAAADMRTWDQPTDASGRMVWVREYNDGHTLAVDWTFASPNGPESKMTRDMVRKFERAESTYEEGVRYNGFGNVIL